MKRFSKSLSILGAPYEFGQRKPGVRLAPQALRDFGLVEDLRRTGLEVLDRGDIRWEHPLQEAETGSSWYRLNASANRQLFEATRSFRSSNQRVLTLGGDHGLALGTIAGVLSAQPETGIIWIDAHADLNSLSTSPSGNFHGMPVAGLLGLFEPELADCFPWLPSPLWPERLVYIGVREIDPGERERITRLGIEWIPPEVVAVQGPEWAIHTALKALRRTLPKEAPIHLSFDIDAVDPKDAPATGTPVPSGIEGQNAVTLVRTLAETGRLESMDLVEVNPTLGENPAALFETLSLAKQLALQAFAPSMPLYGTQDIEKPNTKDISL